MPDEAIAVYDTDTNAQVGQISAEDLLFLEKALEEDSLLEVEFWFDEETVDFLEEHSAPAPLLDFLKKAIAGKEGVELRFGGAALPPAKGPSTPVAATPLVVPVYDADSKEKVGELTRQDVAFLEDALEVEDLLSVNYSFDHEVIEFLVEEKASPQVTKLLRKALGAKEGVELRFGD